VASVRTQLFGASAANGDLKVSPQVVPLEMDVDEAPSSIETGSKSDQTDYGLDGLGDKEKSFRQQQFLMEGNESLRAYYYEEQGNLAVEMHRRMKGVLRWEYVEKAFENIGVGKLGSVKEREAREAKIVQRIKERELRAMKIELFINKVTSLEDNMIILEKLKGKFFNDLVNLSLDPLCVQRIHTMA
jgi:hypothetical protein